MKNVRAAVLLVVVLGAVGPLCQGALAARPDEPPARVSELQAATVPALRGAPASSTPPILRRWVRGIARAGYAANAKLARAVTPPGRSRPWYVIPAAGAVCLFTDENGGTCVSDRDVRAGKLWVAMIEPVGASGVPPAGQPVPAQVIGVAPDGVTGVAATASGVAVAGAVKNGLFSVSASDVTSVRLLRAPIDIAIPDFNGPG